LAESIQSPIDFPAFANSSMDGFAVISSDLLNATPNNPSSLEITEDIPAGCIPQKKLQTGQAARIMTGAMLPEGADCVIQVELTRELPGTSTVHCLASVKPGESVRPIGNDFHCGNQLILAGSQLAPHHLGLLASVGLQEIRVFRKPKIALLTTGNELIPFGSHLEVPKIIDSNSIILSSLIELSGGSIIKLGISRDSEEDIRTHLDYAIEVGADMIISSAGVSVGEYDFMRSVISQRGIIDFWRINIRPGKPFAFGNYGNIPFFGLPGNPVSSFVTFLIFVVPAIKLMCGFNNPFEKTLTATLSAPVESDGRESYLRSIACRTESGEIHVQLTDSHQGSGNLYGLASSNALLIVPSGVKSLPSGAQVKIILIGNLKDE
jgi:molybdopterin molybdotransferase